MISYIALLRGINVGGHRPLKMEDLRKMFLQLGFKKVETYIQSGNVVFEVPESRQTDQLVPLIKEQIEESFGYDVPVVVRSAYRLGAILNNFPFDIKEGWKGYITFLAEEPDSEAKEQLESQSNNIETFKVAGTQVYSVVNKKADQKPQFSNRFIEKQLRVAGTNRNLRTINKVLNLASAE
ncbi:DUF1697 domain-containing protein [Fodinibius halophilus]|uniref:DUF1697 domain-containing protein n=1 Tax=Fodinibius halophilus TaxID=1736908 RepID=A0A6M1T380_9BACT|nr:DUF1697 domain-containing protein [Fodinibius halophilus]NGP87073.1 DUF1697 domain-containing protein [Fodinibius halophilus]